MASRNTIGTQVRVIILLAVTMSAGREFRKNRPDSTACSLAGILLAWPGVRSSRRLVAIRAGG